ncbi:MAG: hypothetical protein R2830_05730 [Saprospiraceae bacterium]
MKAQLATGSAVFHWTGGAPAGMVFQWEDPGPAACEAPAVTRPT